MGVGGGGGGGGGDRQAQTKCAPLDASCYQNHYIYDNKQINMSPSVTQNDYPVIRKGADRQILNVHLIS